MNGRPTIDRADLPVIKNALSLMNLVVAEADRDLRYVWIHNPHPDFDAASVVGKRDDELIDPVAAEDIMGLKRDSLSRGVPVQRILGFQRSDGWRPYCICAYPIAGAGGAVDGVFTVAFDTPDALQGLLPICAQCKKIRDQDGWHSVEKYIASRSRAQFSHGICPDCSRRLYGTYLGDE